MHYLKKGVKILKKLSIGCFDTGVGGISVVKEIKRLLPKESIEYFADHAHQPYGSRSQKEIEGFVIQIINFLLEKGIKACIIGCNVATAAGLRRAKKYFDIPVIGLIEPGAKAAVEATNNGKIGILGGNFTVNRRHVAKAYNKEIIKFFPKAEIFTKYCPKFAPLVESGQFEIAEAYQIAKEYLKPMKKAKIDTLVLGCSHYSFLQKVISDTMGAKVKLVDPAYNTVMILKQILEEKHLLKVNGDKQDIYYTTGDLYNMQNMQKFLRIIFNFPEFNIEKVKVL